MRHEEILNETLSYFKGDRLASETWINKYCLKSNDSYLEKSPVDMHLRITKELDRVESKYPNPISSEKIFELLDNFKYIVPQGGIMAGVGNSNQLTSLSNCFVIESPHDSYPGILHTENHMISLMKRRGGVGFEIGSLRPKDIPTSSVANKSSGVVLFAERFSNTTREVAQDGRRGALMLSCRVDHPDILPFIEAKMSLDKITGANISIAITDDFMKAVKSNGEYETYFINQSSRYSTYVDANIIWDKLMYSAWKSAEPGLLFIDKIHEESPARGYGKKWKETSTNPCGELPLPPNDSCRLLAVNLLSFVVNPFQSEAYFDFKLFSDVVYQAQKIMDDIIDLEIEKLKNIIFKIENDNMPEYLKFSELEQWNKVLDMAVNGRRTGLGITAEADMLAALNLTYGTVSATDFSVIVHKHFAITSYTTSIELAKERGCFPEWSLDKDKSSKFIQRILRELPPHIIDMYYKYGRRNIGNMTIAPTGTTSIMTQTSSGIEPVFSVMYRRRRKVSDDENFTFIDSLGDKWLEYPVIHKGFVQWYDLNWYKIDSRWFDLDFKPDLEHMDETDFRKVFEKSPYYKATANDVNWEEKVRMQGEIQKWIDHSISVTVNVPENTTVETIKKLYNKAYDSGCKGVTVYRDGSRSGVLVNNSKWKYIDAPKRPKVLDCDIYHKTVLGEKKMIIVGLFESKYPYEMYVMDDVDNHTFPSSIERGKITKIKSGVYQLEGEMENKNYTIPNIIDLLSEKEGQQTLNLSLKLRSGIKPIYIRKTVDKYATISSFDKSVVRVLSKYIDNHQSKDTCPICGGELVFKENCTSCKSCDYSKCG